MSVPPEIEEEEVDRVVEEILDLHQQATVDGFVVLQPVSDQQSGTDMAG